MASRKMGELVDNFILHPEANQMLGFGGKIQVETDKNTSLESKPDPLFRDDSNRRMTVHGITEDALARISYYSGTGELRFSGGDINPYVPEASSMREMRERFGTQPPVETHTHSFYELTYICKGTFGYDTPKRRIELHEGDCILMDTALIHRDNYSFGETSCIFLSVSANLFERLVAGPLAGSSCAFVSGSRTTEARYVLYRTCEHSRDVVEDALAAAVEECNRRQLGYLQICSVLAGRVLEALDRCYDAEPVTETADAVKIDIFTQIDRHITQNLATVTPASLAAELHFNPRYYNRVVRERTGLTLTEYIQRRRILTAQRMLRESDASANAIVGAVGYKNVEYFYRIFKQSTGMTPAEYRAREWKSK